MELLHLFHNDHGELSMLAAFLASYPALGMWRLRFRALWADLAHRIGTFVWLWREARCSHKGAREWVTHDYHEEIGAWALECQRCGMYWDQTHGRRPDHLGFLAALWHCLPALFARRPALPPPTTTADPF